MYVYMATVKYSFQKDNSCFCVILSKLPKLCLHWHQMQITPVYKWPQKTASRLFSIYNSFHLN